MVEDTELQTPKDRAAWLRLCSYLWCLQLGDLAVKITLNSLPLQLFSSLQCSYHGVWSMPKLTLHLCPASKTLPSLQSAPALHYPLKMCCSSVLGSPLTAAAPQASLQWSSSACPHYKRLLLSPDCTPAETDVTIFSFLYTNKPHYGLFRPISPLVFPTNPTLFSTFRPFHLQVHKSRWFKGVFLLKKKKKKRNTWTHMTCSLNPKGILEKTPPLFLTKTSTCSCELF